MRDGYAYTTISAHKDEPTAISVSFYLDDDSRIAVCGGEGARPLLVVSYGNVSVTIAPVPGEVTERDVRVARILAERVASYTAQVEQLFTGNGAAAA